MTKGILFGLSLLLSLTAAAESYVGIGITIEKRDNQMLVVDLLPNGPADRAGVLRGEYLTAVDGHLVFGKSVQDVSNLIRGLAGTRVELTLASLENERRVSIVRELVTAQCVMEGSVNLRYSGDEHFGWLSGTIGKDRVQWSVNNLRVFGSFKNDPIRMELRRNEQTGYLAASGWFRNHSISWSGFMDSINTFQPCIP